MPSLFYFAAYTDSGCLIGCAHRHSTVIAAVACIIAAGGYVIAVEDGELRELNRKEEAVFQFAMYSGEKVALDRPARLFPRPALSTLN